MDKKSHLVTALRVREIFSMAADYRVGFRETTHFFSFMQVKKNSLNLINNSL